MFNQHESKDLLRLEFSTELRNIDRVIDVVREFLACRRLDKMHFGTALVCREGVTNAMRHGNCMCIERIVRLELVTTGTQLRITVEDQGSGWDWAMHDHCLPDNTCESGRGLFLIQSFAQKVYYNDAGNRLHVHMDINPDAY